MNSHGNFAADPNEPEAVRDEIYDWLRGVRDDHPVLLAIKKLLDFQIEVADRETNQRQLDPQVRAHCAGTEWGLKQFRAALLIMHRKAQAAPDKSTAGQRTP